MNGIWLIAITEARGDQGIGISEYQETMGKIGKNEDQKICEICVIRGYIYSFVFSYLCGLKDVNFYQFLSFFVNSCSFLSISS